MALMAPAIVAPMQLGNSKVLDASLELLISLCRYSSPQSMTITQLEPLSRSYLKALKLAMVSVTTPHLRDQEKTAAALSLLFATGTLIQLYDRSWDGGMSHLSGAFTLLCAKPPNRQASPAIKAALCAAGFHTFISPTFAGIVSPFEDPAWLDMELVQLRDVSEKLVRLRRVNHQLFIKLPRLIAGVRALRNGEMEILAEVMALSDELMALEDKEAETWLLHRVRIVNNRDSGDKVIVACFSFEFPVLEEMDVAICYWQTHLTLTKLRSVVASLAPSALVGEGPCKPQDRAALRGCTFYRNIPVAVVETWLFKAFQRSWLGWTTRQSFAQFDGVCAVLDGGPLNLFMLDAMEGPRSSISLHAHKNQKATTRRTNAK
ncbi:hypothetical protein LTR15_005952 [Elasticomyces elasticus]|nr:hypothetical protein LTR15_005952 [Elasticomyces elasticus]